MIAYLSGIDAAGWRHVATAVGEYSSNITYGTYSVSKDGAVRIQETFMMGPVPDTEHPDYFKIDDLEMAVDPNGDVVIGVVGHGRESNAYMEVVFENAWKVWPEPAPGQQSFPDVPPSNPFHSYIERMYMAGRVRGRNDGLFHPEQDVTRGQASAMIVGSEGRPDE
jgi:hypothetical protein